MNDLELQQYLFDLNGYLVIEDALSSEEVAVLNRLINAQGLAATGGIASIRQRADPGFVAFGRRGLAGKQDERRSDYTCWIRFP